ncbi:hypothetical protein PR001_g23641 [Phytophthora rubi]|uniref:RxLR effector protein n=1 Tax=Phytophthora rubi TaxID=129364 RepID=A0A6A3IM27_9STRA|nr:hypothetical protein PR001_g23641 [Phytophthora rubi]
MRPFLSCCSATCSSSATAPIASIAIMLLCSASSSATAPIASISIMLLCSATPFQLQSCKFQVQYCKM